MKKIVALLFFTLTIAGAVNSQNRVSVDNLRFDYTVRELPKEPYEPAFFHYSRSVKVSPSVKTHFSQEELEDRIKVEGQRIAGDQSDMHIALTFGNLNIKESKVEKTRSIEEKKDGKVVSTTSYYNVVVRYSFYANMTVTGNETELVNYNIYKDNDTEKYETKEFSSSKEASEYWQNNRENIKDELIRKCVNYSIQYTNNYLSKTYGFALSKGKDALKTISTKKHPENENLRLMSETLKSKLEKMDGTTPLNEADFEKSIEYFKNLPERYKYTEKEAKANAQLRYVAYFNLATLYLYLDKPETAKEYAELLTNNDFNPKDGNSIIKEAEKLIERFGKTTIKTRQFDPDSYFTDSPQLIF